MMSRAGVGFAALCAVGSTLSHAQTAQNIIALQGLSPITALPNTAKGQAVLDANLRLTGEIQTGAFRQPLLLPFSDQQKLALKDSFIADGNFSDVADGLGTKLADTYRLSARYQSVDAYSNISPSVAVLISYTAASTKSDANSGKYFFANATTDSTTPASNAADAILRNVSGTTDVYGKTYQRLAGSLGGDLYGNPRPFQTTPTLVAFRATDYFGQPSHSLDWLRGPVQNLTDSPSYPSYHATYGYTSSLLLAILVPERYQQMITRAAEYGNDRIILGAHYTIDVLGGRALALHSVAHLLANDPAFVGQSFGKTSVISDYNAALSAARDDLTAFLSAHCGSEVAVCAVSDSSRFSDPASNEAFYNATQTYGLPIVNQQTVDAVEDVGKVAPQAGYLLTAAFPSLTLDEANTILTETEGPGGGFLDDGSEFGVYSRINLYAAAGKAMALAASKHPVTSSLK